jgi:hypothetical protein
MRELFGQEFEVWDLCGEQTDVDVVHQDKENRQATEQVDPVQTFPSCGLICRIRRRHGSFSFRVADQSRQSWDEERTHNP